MYNIEDIRNKILCGDSLTELKKIPNESVDCVVTSPPYLYLRDYGIDGQIGLEPNPDDYITKLCGVFDEVKRVLKPTGTVFVNLGDTFSTKSGSGFLNDNIGRNTCIKNGLNKANELRGKGYVPNKSLMGMPERFMIEMLNRKWILRNKIIWKKSNILPSSQKDRFTQDWEYVYFFTKEPHYYFEQRFEPLAESSIKRSKYGWHGTKLLDGKSYNGISETEEMGTRFAPENGRNMRCIWEIPTKGFKGKHYASFPEKLIEVPISAGCPELVCKKCGTPKEKVYGGKSSDAFNIRVRDVKEDRIKHTDRKASKEEVLEYDEKEYGGEGRRLLGYKQCSCNSGFERGIVLDPFMGAATTAVVAKKLGRDFVGIELNPTYVEMGLNRLKDVKVSKTLGDFCG